MTLAFRSHLDTHPMDRSNIGAGLMRAKCTICPHVHIEEAPAVLCQAAHPTLPAWMRRTIGPLPADRPRAAVA